MALIAIYFLTYSKPVSDTMQIPAESGNSVTIQNFAFNPQTLTVAVGTTVTWTNQDSATHKINSNTFNSSDLSKGATFSYTFQTPGTYDYSCSIHPYMTGKIIVQ